VDTVIIDTAGRLHTKAGLMDELGKIKRVVSRQAEVDEVLLVLDATTGQNGLRQARVFAEAVDVTGIILTKLDGTARGGIVVAVQRELGVPVKLVGLGRAPTTSRPSTRRRSSTPSWTADPAARWPGRMPCLPGQPHNWEMRQLLPAQGMVNWPRDVHLAINDHRAHLVISNANAGIASCTPVFFGKRRERPGFLI